MPESHAVRDARVPGRGLAENSERAQGLGDGSAAGLISEHR
jgi:hypothetical protein